MNEKWLPNDTMPPITQSVAFFRIALPQFTQWFRTELGQDPLDWTQRNVAASDPELLFRSLHPLADVGVTRYMLVSLSDNWTAMLNNSKLGTDVGMIPSIATRKLGVQAIRAMAKQESQESFGAFILEVYEPTAELPLRCRRTISAANDGGKWQFDQFGEPLSFEDTAAYTRKKIQDRFTRELLYRYLFRLEVPPFIPNALACDSIVLLEERMVASK